MAFLAESLDPTLRGEVQKLKPKPAMTLLRTKYDSAKRIEAKAKTMQQELEELSLKDCSSVGEYLDEIESLEARLAASGQGWYSTQLFFKVFSGLTPEYWRLLSADFTVQELSNMDMELLRYWLPRYEPKK
ncbi:hypothetical protein H2200_010414 [Cladophialophora chaetospira]|uniref:Uncharacterized protein n=1 Tax=Cladophialophora chaetospira TaxID=386627 RepID=A0AA38X1E9_9EURO|nr:hypothetical protein H2200_010414 [Cladophialophora chaetospira]